MQTPGPSGEVSCFPAEVKGPEADQGGLEKAHPFSLRDQWFESISLQRRVMRTFYPTSPSRRFQRAIREVERIPDRVHGSALRRSSISFSLSARNTRRTSVVPSSGPARRAKPSASNAFMKRRDPPNQAGLQAVFEDQWGAIPADYHEEAFSTFHEHRAFCDHLARILT